MILREAKQVGKLTRRIGAHVARAVWPSRTSDRTPELSTILDEFPRCVKFLATIPFGVDAREKGNEKLG